MSAYTTIDYLPDLTSPEMAAASWLNFSTITSSITGWDNSAQVSGSDSYAILHDTYKIIAFEGATYDIFSTSFFDPYLLRVYDQYGNTIVANDESDDGNLIYLVDAYYSQDIVWNWVAPYTGTYYVSANWNQGSYYKFYALQIYEDLDTIAVDNEPPNLLIVTSDSSLGLGESAVISFILSEASTNFTLSDVTVSGGVLSNFSGSGANYSAIFTPSANSTVNGVVSVASGKFSDAAGNYNVDGYEANNTVTMSVNTVTESEVFGTSTNDRLFSSTGNDLVDGGQGIDTVVYSGSASQYTIQLNRVSGIATVNDSQSGRDGSDTLTSIERLQFADKGVALDLDGATSAGGIFRLYQATFDRTPDLGGLGYWIDRADAGQSAISMAEDFVWSQEFQQLYGVTTRDQYLGGSDITALVTGFYQNVLNRAPDQGGLDFYVGVINSQERTVGRVLAEISDSPENYAATIGVIQNGIQYDIWQG